MEASALTGSDLNYWVGRADGLDMRICQCDDGSRTWAEIVGTAFDYAPSSNWSQGGRIIERERILLSPYKPNWWRAVHFPSGDEDTANLNPGELIGPKIAFEDASPLVAAMRCFVASKFGDAIHSQGMKLH